MKRELARAKINLTLEIMGKRSDGYHELASLVVFADYGDVLSVDGSGEYSLSVNGPFARKLEGENLIDRAVRFAERRWPGIRSGHMLLEKNLPVASGIGGGSADAAAALRLLMAENGFHIAVSDYPVLARELGADIPVCIEQKAVMMSGMGEKLAHVPDMPELPGVLINSGVAVATGEIFKRLNAPPLNSGFTDAEPAHFMDAAAVIAYMTGHGNHLQKVAEEIEPVISRVISSLEEQDGCMIARMSGSGATCFGIFGSIALAEAATGKLRQSHQDWWVQNCILQ